jgi:hypothetical protein
VSRLGRARGDARSTHELGACPLLEAMPADLGIPVPQRIHIDLVACVLEPSEERVKAGSELL